MTSYEEKYPVGTYIMAPIYKLRHQGITEPQRVKVVGFSSSELCAQGCRYGVYVEYNGSTHWVYPGDIVPI